MRKSRAEPTKKTPSERSGRRRRAAPPPTPHDALFKEAFSGSEHARPMLRWMLPARLSKHVDWASLKRRPGSFVNEDLREQHTDLLFSATLGKSQAYFYLLFEHQSTADRWMLLRLLEYMIRIWRDHLAKHPKASRLPVIVPLVLHHSDAGWTCATAFEELLDVDGEARAAALPYVPRFEVVLDDVSHATDDDLRGRAITALGKVVLGCFRHARDMRTMVSTLRSWRTALDEVRSAPHGMRALALVLRYIFHAAGDMAPEEIRTLVAGAVDPKVEEEIVSLADKLMEQGRQEGLQKGLQKGLQSGRRKGRQEGWAEIVLKQLRLKFGEVPAAEAERVRAGTQSELGRWAERVLVARSLAEVFDG